MVKVKHMRVSDVVDAALPGDLAIADGFFFVGISQGKVCYHST